MAVTDLTGYTWVGNSSLSFTNTFSYSISFTSNNNNYTSFVCAQLGRPDILNYNNDTVYAASWIDNAYKTIVITGGTDATNAQLIAWLEANGTLTAPTPQVSYPNSFQDVSLTDNNGYITLTINGVDFNLQLEEPAPTVVPYLTFSSPNSFTLGVVDNQKYWDGTLEYSTDGTTWNTWAGTSAISSASDGTNHNLYLRGTGNTYITGSSASNTKVKWVLTGNDISCEGNIENLLDYATVSLGNHPVMAMYCYAYMFRDCTSLTSLPELPATTLTIGCYSYMFKNCTLLTTLPELLATTLAMFCYFEMFNGCSLIKLSATQTGDYQTPYRIPTTGTGTTATSALDNMFANTGGSFTGTPSINTTYYTSNTVIPAGGNS